MKTEYAMLNSGAFGLAGAVLGLVLGLGMGASIGGMPMGNYMMGYAGTGFFGGGMGIWMAIVFGIGGAVFAGVYNWLSTRIN